MNTAVGSAPRNRAGSSGFHPPTADFTGPRMTTTAGRFYQLRLRGNKRKH
ncbi:hypothetical protein GBF38_008887, partial [Nibea albiflora]